MVRSDLPEPARLARRGRKPQRETPFASAPHIPAHPTHSHRRTPMADEVTQSRDAEVAGRIASTDIALVALCTDTKNMIDHAERNNAYGHARLYEQVHNA